MTLCKTNLCCPFLPGSPECPGWIHSTQVISSFLGVGTSGLAPSLVNILKRFRILCNLPRAVKYLVFPSQGREEATIRLTFQQLEEFQDFNEECQWLKRAFLFSHSDFQEFCFCFFFSAQLSILNIFIKYL